MTTTHELTAESLENQMGRRIAARLDQASNGVSHDISERLRIARSMALDKRRVLKPQMATEVSSVGNAAALQLGGDHFNMWNRMASLFPLLALLIGLLAINVIQDERRAFEIAEVDAELLTDDLPPDAYTDPGFAQFLRVQQE
ncbi:MAG: DUF3619 family protein [Rhodoferax sp.]|nr:DUF3619 family protein [Rhodoferax sp.]